MRNLKVLIAASLGLTLAGCGALGTNTSMYSAHQPVVERTNYEIDINVDGRGIPDAEQVRMGEWFDALQLRYGDRVAVDYGNGYFNVDAQNAIAVTSGQVAAGTVRVIVTRSTASVPSCPDWSSTSDSNFNTNNHSNYGCSINSNLAAMIADPEDLVRGRDNKALDKNTGKNAVNAYRSKTNGGN
jgi:pilus assembly protein CpaD